MDTLTERWQNILGAIEAHRKASPAAAAAVTLIAVTKGRGAEEIEPLLKAGQHDFGENRVQEAAAKWPEFLARYPGICLHLIGPLQTNKVKEALRLFDAIHTVDRQGLADAIIKGQAEGRGLRCRQFFVQVNTGEEPQKSGVAPAELPALMNYLFVPRSPPLITVTGLMCVPPAAAPAAPHFALLRKLAREYHLPNLSMGMSNDFETAVRLGATHVRVGTAIFGGREG